jgi:hypothetical protein
MIGRALRKAPKALRPSPRSFSPSVLSRPVFARRVAASVLAGVGLVSVALWSFDPGIAAELARNADSPIGFIVSQAARGETAGETVRPERERPPGRVAMAETRKGRSDKIASRMFSKAVCVRLCDGYFFPKSEGASCGALCPGAATQVFLQPSGADGIEKAVSLAGGRYTALPAAFRYRTAIDRTCGCGVAAPLDEQLAALRDATLRTGDVVMTAGGMRVFEGGRRRGGAFAGLGQAPMPAARREILLAMERTAHPPRHAIGAVAAIRPTLGLRAGAIRWAPVRHLRTAWLR